MKNRVKKSGADNLFSRIEAILSFRGFLDDLTNRYVIKAIFIFSLGLFYIANSHLYDRTVRRINELLEEVEELKVDLTFLKADYMLSNKRSEVARHLEPYGIRIPSTPPYVVRINKE